MLRSRNNPPEIRLLITVLVLSLSIYASPVPTRLFNSSVSANRSILSNYVEHDPINITNDGELAAVANSGTGTVNDPYVIAGWNITGIPTHGISITGTTKHFRIENCWIRSTVGWRGLYVLNSTSGTTTITNNICNSNSYGILLSHSPSSTVANN
ncbi:MAG: right-handed parallel beta-helix repeat-containing protein, partial [Candidatus Hodarchaeales archaeon]